MLRLICFLVKIENKYLFSMFIMNVQNKSCEPLLFNLSLKNIDKYQRRQSVVGNFLALRLTLIYRVFFHHFPHQ